MSADPEVSADVAGEPRYFLGVDYGDPAALDSAILVVAARLVAMAAAVPSYPGGLAMPRLFPRPRPTKQPDPARQAAAADKRARKAARRLRERRGEADPLLPLLLGVAWVLLAALTPIGLAVVAAALAVPEVMP